MKRKKSVHFPELQPLKETDVSLRELVGRCLTILIVNFKVRDIQPAPT